MCVRIVRIGKVEKDKISFLGTGRLLRSAQVPAYRADRALLQAPCRDREKERERDTLKCAPRSELDNQLQRVSITTIESKQIAGR